MKRFLAGRDHVYIIGEIGINHCGDINLAKRLIASCAGVGCDAVKFQKRNVDVVYTPEELAQPRESVFGSTNGDLKRGLEFSREDYDEIHRYCKELNIEWFASPWDEDSVDFLLDYNLPYLKVASASITDKDLLIKMASTGIPLIISTGMSDLDIIEKAVTLVEDYGTVAALLHCTSTYPSNLDEINLLGIRSLQQFYGDIPIGYSGHERGVPQSIMAAALDAAVIERHVTLDRTMWGSDQAASLEIEGMRQVVKGVRGWERSRGNGDIKIYDSELPIIEKLRRKSTL